MKKKAMIGWWCAVGTLYVVFFCYYSVQAYRKPVWNWDMVFYIAASQAYLTDDSQHIYDRTIEYATQAYSQRGEGALKHFREMELWPDAEALRQALPYYTIKPFYIVGMLALHETGIPLYLTTSLLSIAGFLMAGAACFLMRPRGIDPGLWWLSVMVFCTAGHWIFIDLPRWSTPDTLCTAFFLAGLCFWLYRRSAVGFGICMLLSQLARPDALMLTLVLTAAFTFDPFAEHRMRYRHAALIAAVMMAVYWLVNHMAGNYGWANLFNYMFFNRVPYPASLGADFTFQQYFDVLEKGLRRMAMEPRVQGLMLMSMVATFMHLYFPVRHKRGHFLLLLWLGWGSLLARFVLMPSWQERYFYPNYFLMLYASAELIGGAWAMRRRLSRILPLRRYERCHEN